MTIAYLELAIPVKLCWDEDRAYGELDVPPVVAEWLADRMTPQHWRFVDEAAQSADELDQLDAEFDRELSLRENDKWKRERMV